MKEQKSGREFGMGTFLGDDGQTFLGKSRRGQVLEMGWSHACPVINEVIEKYGEEWTLKRYAECNFVFGLILESAKINNPSLYAQLLTPVKRLQSENPGRGFNSEFIPDDFYQEMSPLSTPWGYALPRIVIEQMGRGENNKNRTQLRIIKSLGVVESAVKKSRSPIELLVKMSEMVTRLDADPKAVLSHVLAQGILEEEGTLSIFKDIKRKIDKWAPTLKTTYNSMDLDTKKALGIIENI